MSLIGITMGCPVGIGPEIILKFFLSVRRRQHPAAVVIGDPAVLNDQARHFGFAIEALPWLPGERIPEGKIPVFAASSLQPGTLKWGKPDATTGKAMARYIEKGVELIQDSSLSGLVTCPITKWALQQAGYLFPGHTEMLADLTGSRHFSMMMAGRHLKVTLATIHCGFADIVPTLQRASILECIQLTYQALRRDFDIAAPFIAVAGLNPHAGEGGLFGNEEETIITPAIDDARQRGINASGPYPPDTIFYQASQGKYDAVVCMYHDQGLIPFKLLHFSDGVNVTLGLPIVRTSVDHGTAYDIAGKGIADPSSLGEAVMLAEKISANRKRNTHLAFSSPPVWI